MLCEGVRRVAVKYWGSDLDVDIRGHRGIWMINGSGNEEWRLKNRSIGIKVVLWWVAFIILVLVVHINTSPSELRFLSLLVDAK